jgi:hypothetical protein
MASNVVDEGDNLSDRSKDSNPARDFVPPPSDVRKRPPTSHISRSERILLSRETEEVLAYRAASDQLAGHKQWQHKVTERKLHQVCPSITLLHISLCRIDALTLLTFHTIAPIYGCDLVRSIMELGSNPNASHDNGSFHSPNYHISVTIRPYFTCPRLRT